MRKSLKVSLAATILALTSACGAGDAGLTSAEAGSSNPAAAAPAAASDPLTRENFVERLSVAQQAAGSAHLEMASPIAGGAVSMQGDVRLAEDVEDSQARVTMGAGPMRMDLRMVDGLLYVKLGELSGGKFIEVDLQDPKDPVGRHYGSMTGQIDPTEQLKLFREALVEFENQGSGGEIDGVETTKLRLVLDSTKMLGETTPGAILGDGRKVEYVLYVGSDDLLRQVTAEHGEKTTEVTWTKWGEPVEVEAPPADEVTDSSMLGDLAGLLDAPKAS